MAAEVVSSVKCFNGKQMVFKHHSKVLNCDMQFGAYLPETRDKSVKLPTLFYLSGLTCTHANVMEKSGMQRVASGLGMVVVHPDTSPRGVDLEGDAESWDFGKGAGFYVDATEKPWSSHYKMYSYVTEELPALVKELLPVDEGRIGVFGHSMGGHGALVCSLRRPDLFRSVSAFAPISHPTNCPWGKKAFAGYLGPDESTWEQYDAALLLKKYNGPAREILVDQGGADSFLASGQLQPESLASCQNVKVTSRIQDGYDHSYYFIATFMEEHLKHHLEQLNKKD